MMELCNPSQIKALLENNGFHFSKAMGQNFLIAPWVPERIAEASGAGSGVGVLEIGPGIGCLTAELAKRADKVVAVELDDRLPPILAQSLAEFSNVEIVPGDALKLDLAALADEKLAGLTPIVCANIPYNITSPLITAFLEADRFETVTVMIQREVTRRICAAPGSADYGAFTLLCRWYAEPELLFEVSPDCFLPQPAVTSAVLRMKKRGAPPVQVKDEALYFRIIRAAFAQRRKTLLNALSAGLGGFDKEQLREAFYACGIDERARGETLSAEAFAALANALH